MLTLRKRIFEKQGCVHILKYVQISHAVRVSCIVQHTCRVIQSDGSYNTLKVKMSKNLVKIMQGIGGLQFLLSLVELRMEFSIWGR